MSVGWEADWADHPWSDSEVAVGSASSAWPYPVEIDGHGYVMDLAKWIHRTLPQFRQQSDTSREPGEQSLSIEGVWKRTGQGAYRGAGQEFYDDDASDRNRFYWSHGIDPWRRRHITLLADTELVREVDSSNPQCIKIGAYLFVTDDEDLHYTQDPLDAVPNWTDQDPFNGGGTATISSIASDGSKLYLACGSQGLRVVTPGVGGATVLVPVATFAPTVVVYANGWLLAMKDNLVRTIDSVGAATALFNHRNPDFDWVTGASAPNAIYLGGNSGDRAEFYRTTVNDTGAALATPIFAGDLPAGETVYTMSYYSGLMLIGTSRGLRVATIDQDGGLSIGAVIEDLSGQGCRAFEARGQYAWFGHVNTFHLNRRGLARADLANNTEEGVPAYAADIASTETTGRTTSITTWIDGGSEYRLFCVSGSGLWVQRDDLVEEGTLDFGWLGWGSPEHKQLQTVSVAHDSLRGKIVVRVTSDTGTVSEAEQVQQSTFSTDELIRANHGELLDLQIVLRRDADDAALGPALRRWTARVVPSPASVDEILCPILLADLVRDDGTKKEIPYDPFAEYRFLKSAEDQRRVVTYREGQASYEVTIRSVGMETSESWTKGRRFLQGVLLVRMVTIEGVPPRLPGDVF